MHISLNCLPHNPSTAQACALIAHAPLPFWMPVLEHLRATCDLPGAHWQRLPEGANALFQLGEEVIVKLVPPNWRRQGDKELLLAPILEGKLALETPRLIGGGMVDNWVFVIVSRLQGVALAAVWPTLGATHKHAIMRQVGQLLRELGAVAVDAAAAIRVDWPGYLDALAGACLARHLRKGMPPHLAQQVMPYLAGTGEFARATQPRLIHMDIHPWNLMARDVGGQWRVTGLIDFGDAIVGHSDRFELITPLMFMAQGDPLLARALIDAYGVPDQHDAPTLQRQLMATALVRPDSDLGFCMRQVPVSGPRDTWEQIARQLFPL